MAITVNGKPDVPAPLPVVPRIGQVVYATSSSVTSIAAATGWVNLTGFSVTITPTSATSKIIIMTTAQFTLNNTGGTQFNSGMVGFARNGTNVTYSMLGQYYPSSTTGTYISVNSLYSNQFVDSPATTSAITYTLQGNNISSIPSMTGNSGGTAGQIIAMEVLV